MNYGARLKSVVPSRLNDDLSVLSEGEGRVRSFFEWERLVERRLAIFWRYWLFRCSLELEVVVKVLRWLFSVIC
jgi:hypothetical protein